MQLLTTRNGPFGAVGMDSWGNPPGYSKNHLTHDYINPCDQYPGGTWLKPGTYTYSVEEYKKYIASQEITTPEEGIDAIKGSVEELKESFNLLTVRMVDMELTNDSVIEFLDKVKPQTPELDAIRIQLLVKLHTLKAGNTKMFDEENDNDT